MSEIRKVKIENDRPTVGRPKEVEILGGHESRRTQVQTLSTTQHKPDVPIETYDRDNPPPQPDVELDVELHDTHRSFSEETRK